MTAPVQYAAARPSRLRAWFARIGDAAAFEERNHERVVVYILVFAAVMGAAAIWQAAEHGDRADNLFQQGRTSELLRQQQHTSLMERIEHDMTLSGRYASHLVARDGLLRGTVLADSEEADALVAQAAAEEIARRSVEPFFLLGRRPADADLAAWTTGDAPVYDADYVRREEELGDLGVTVLDATPITAEAERDPPRRHRPLT